MPQKFFRLRGQDQKLESFSSQTLSELLSRSLRLKPERRVGRRVEEEMKKESEKENTLGREEVPRKLPSGKVCNLLDNEKCPKKMQSPVTFISQKSTLELLLFGEK